MKRNVFVKFVLIFLISFLCEIFLFNFRFWESMHFQPVSASKITYGPGLEKMNKGMYQIKDSQSAYIEMTHIDQKVNNIYTNFDAEGIIDLRFEVTDSGNSNYISLPKTEVVSNVLKSKYHRLHLIGPSQKIKIDLLNAENTKIKVNEVKLNTQVPFIFLYVRLLFIYILLLLLYLFRPGSGIYKMELNWKDKTQKIIICSLVALQMGSIAALGYISCPRNWQNDAWLANNQYNYLANSLIEGHTYLDFKAPDFLKEMKNPYDKDERNRLAKQTNESFVWDFAYYKGKYYSYFGIVPALLFFVPYQLLTGQPLPTWVPVVLCSMLFSLAVFWFLYTLIKRSYSSVSLGIFLLFGLLMVASSEILYGVTYANIYVMPIMIGLLLDITGITCWMHAVDDQGNIHKKWLLAGALSIALVMGCRPQLSVVFLFAFPLFWEAIKKRLFFSWQGLANTLSVILPFLCVGLGLMFYNCIRFDSPFDFGATYNLTGFDMTSRGFVWDRFWLGYFEYLFQPFRVINQFPFLTTVADHMQLMSDYQGQIINEPLMGGFFAFNSIGWLLFVFHPWKAEMKTKEVWKYFLFFFILGLVIISVDIQMVGMTLRYLMDFSLFLMIAVVVLLLTILDDKIDKSYYKKLLSIIVPLSLFCIFINYFALCADGRYAQLRNTYWLFYTIKYSLFII